MYRKHVGRALILALMLSGATSMNAQRITRQFKNVPLKTVLAEVEKELQYSIIYKKDEVNERKQITRDFKDASLEEVLSAVLDNGLSYSVQGKMIVISKKEAAGSSITQQKQIIVKGIVKDENGEPVVGANVVEKGTSNGTITDMDGGFSLSVSENAKLNVTYIGYLDQVVTIGKNQTSLNIQLKEDTQALDEVLVVGYGTQKKVTLTGSVVALKGEEITKSPSINIANSLAGRLPGVIINNRSGEPGRDDPSIFIRGKSTTGNASPLILIDGVERGGLGELNPNDIENISVLKDASAAIYGARAANGVILVTTKRGAEVKPSINLSFNQGFSQSTRTPKMVDSYTYAKVYNEIEEGEGRLPRYSLEELEKYRNGTDPNYPNTDWFDLMIKNVTPQHRANLSVAGGNERVKYYLSLGESHQSGHFKEGTTDVRIYP